jgi:hypothetical protein
MADVLSLSEVSERLLDVPYRPLPIDENRRYLPCDKGPTGSAKGTEDRYEMCRGDANGIADMRASYRHAAMYA